MIFNIILGSYEPKNLDNLIGVDRSAYNLLKNGYDVFLSIGDFDSITDDEFNFVLKNSKTIKLDVLKDETDLEAAIIYLKENYDCQIIVHNFNFGNRVDHLFSIINLLRTYDVILKDDHNIISLAKNNEIYFSSLDYISFYAFEEVKNLCISNLKYEINKINLKIKDHKYISNESLKNDHFISFDEGLLLIIESSD